MFVPVPQISVGSPVQCGPVTVFPLFHEVASRAGYILAQEAMAAGSVSVRETSASGTVPYIQVANNGDEPVLVVEGEEFRGAKQNRVAGASILVAPRNESVIPVLCTEWGRWRRDTEEFAVGAFCPPSLRHLLKHGRRTPANGASRHSPSQMNMWKEIRRKNTILGIISGSQNMSDALVARRAAVDALRTRFPVVGGATGIAVCVNEKIICMDVFDTHATLASLWDRIVQGITLDTMDTFSPGRDASLLDVMILACEMTDLPWRWIASVDQGEEYIAEHRDGALASALVVDGTVVHASFSAPIN